MLVGTASRAVGSDWGKLRGESVAGSARNRSPSGERGHLVARQKVVPGNRPRPRFHRSVSTRRPRRLSGEASRKTPVLAWSARPLDRRGADRYRPVYGVSRRVTDPLRTRQYRAPHKGVAGQARQFGGGHPWRRLGLSIPCTCIRGDGQETRTGPSVSSTPDLDTLALSSPVEQRL